VPFWSIYINPTNDDDRMTPPATDDDDDDDDDDDSDNVFSSFVISVMNNSSLLPLAGREIEVLAYSMSAYPISGLMLLVGQQEWHSACKKHKCWHVGGRNWTGKGKIYR